MKKLFDNKSLQTIKIAILLILFAIISYKVIGNIEEIYTVIVNIFDVILKVLLPFILGGFIAFLLNSSVDELEKNIKVFFKINKKSKFIRVTTVTLVYLALVSIISIIIIYLIPTVKNSFEEFQINMPNNIEKLQGFINEFGYDDISIDVEKEVMNYVTAFVQKEGNVSSFLTGVMSVTNTFFNIILGLIIAFYILVDKEELYLKSRKTLIALFNLEKTRNFFNYFTYVRKTFDKFIIGKLIDSFIIGVITYIFFVIIKIKYALLFSVIIGITNVIPYFGPFMGGIPVCLLVLLLNPRLLIVTAVFILVLQQIDGNIIGPKILGDAIGVKPVEVIFAIIVGGAVGGVLGMFLAVPTFVIISDLISKIIDKKYKNNMKGNG